MLFGVLVHVVLTGGTGFLGRHLAKLLLNRGLSVTVLIRNRSDLSALRNLSTGDGVLRIVNKDTQPLTAAFEPGETHAVIHAATTYGHGGAEKSQILASNLAFPMRLLAAADKADVPLFINTDTYFNKASPRYAYLANYSVSKRLFVERATRSAFKTKFLTLRLEHVYGADDNPNKFMSAAIQEISVKKSPRFPATLGQQRRDFIHVNDVSRAYELLLLSPEASNVSSGSTFEIGTGVSTRVREVLELIKALSGSPTEIDFGALPYRKHEIMLSRADSIFGQIFGWEAEIPLIDGLSDLVNRKLKTQN